VIKVCSIQNLSKTEQRETELLMILIGLRVVAVRFEVVQFRVGWFSGVRGLNCIKFGEEKKKFQQ